MHTFIVIGAGHRAAFYLRMATYYPEKMQAIGAVVRNPEKREAFQAYWGMPAFGDLGVALAAQKPDFAILTVDPEASLGYIEQLAADGVPVLCETPPGLTVEELNKISALVRGGAKVQVTEQYNFVPSHAARLNIIKQGLLGEVSYARIAVAHAYHGLSLLRHFLRVNFENAKVTAFEVPGKLLDGPTRYNTYVPEKRVVQDSPQTLAVFEFPGKTGLFDFVGEQYSSWVRRQHIHVYGETGEIVNFDVHLLKDERTPVEMPLRRMDTAEYDYMYLHGFTLGEQWVYQNPYKPVLEASADSTFYGRVWDFASPSMRITDDEIAVLDVLFGMCAYVDGGPDVYSFAEGAQDQYMQLVIEQSIREGRPVMMETQDWAK